MKAFILHFKKYIVRGIITLIPVMLTALAIYFLYTAIDKKTMVFLERYIGFRIPGLGLLIVLLIIYFIGLFVSNVIGKKLIAMFEQITNRIPLVKTTYSIGKQLASAFSLPEKQTFKKVVMVPYLKSDMWTIGFVTGYLIDNKSNNEKLLKVYIPTPPNPTSGTMVIVRESQTRDPGWSVRDALNTVISGGIIGPEKIH